MAEYRRAFGITRNLSTVTLDPRAWYDTVCEGSYRFTAVWVREEENASETRQSKRDAEEADNVEVPPRMIVGSLRRFRAASMGPTQGLPKRCRRRRGGTLRTLESTVF